MITISDKEVSLAKALAKQMQAGQIPVNEVREFLERIGQKSEAVQSEPRKRGLGKKTLMRQHIRSII